jgi:ribosomal-protein-alanine N-acetyltransferase
MATTANSSHLIRNYDPRESHILHRIDSICFPPGIAYSLAELRYYLEHPKSIARVAERQGRVIGFAVGRTDNKTGHVVTLDVLPEERHNGVGSSLMEALHTEFRGRRAVMSYLEVGMENGAAVRFYEKLGYRVLENIPGYYGGRQDAYRMTRPL